MGSCRAVAAPPDENSGKGVGPCPWRNRSGAKKALRQRDGYGSGIGAGHIFDRLQVAGAVGSGDDGGLDARFIAIFGEGDETDVVAGGGDRHPAIDL